MENGFRFVGHLYKLFSISFQNKYQYFFIAEKLVFFITNSVKETLSQMCKNLHKVVCEYFRSCHCKEDNS